MLLNVTGPLEALLFAAGSEGLTTEELADVLQLGVEETRQLCLQLQKQYDERGAGLALVEFAGSWQLVTRPEHAIYLRRLAHTPVATQLSTAALEVLSIVAYRQPISRAEIEDVRGVKSDRAIATLVHRRLIAEVGRQNAPGRPILYGTTDTFLQTFGLRSLEDLPPLPEMNDASLDLALFEQRASVPRD
ncbi:SMC-Scp complex subunit ScpB [Alicyclobacillus kakegawensis]|uniref:SMC-Scp complex subunit ScpB n=1 Tax=Alicyclobacillus kakegawensis TaxID=392012 RepID=UPI000AB20B9D|nr:SMC-Scp complex subunit ScpB [Alicyclobacillus kakegawensis]